jgi:hypothetical protein
MVLVLHAALTSGRNVGGQLCPLGRPPVSNTQVLAHDIAQLRRSQPDFMGEVNEDASKLLGRVFTNRNGCDDG